jgi:acetoin utilization deacetylase AcuC-like enzyme
LDTDKLGRLNISLEGCKTRDKIVMKNIREAAVPMVVSMGGGYSEKLSIIIEAHANTYRMAQDIYF